MVQHAKELLADVARHRADLIGLRADLDITPDRMKKCAPAVDDLESAIAEILTVARVPRTIPELTSSIASVRMNIRCVHEQVDECIDDVIERGRMDEYLKLRHDFDGPRAGVSAFSTDGRARELHEVPVWMRSVCARMDKLTLNNDPRRLLE